MGMGVGWILSAGDQGEDLTGGIGSAFLGQLNGEQLEVSNLLAGHGGYRWMGWGEVGRVGYPSH